MACAATRVSIVSAPAFRIWHLLLVAIIIALAVAAPSQAETFDRVAAKERYRDWYRRFETDFAEFEKACRPGPLDAGRVSGIFVHSVAPDSRMTRMLLDFSARPGLMRGSNAEPGAVSMALIMVTTLEQALPAGFGGAYHPEKPVPGDADSFVWYIHIHAGDSMRDFFGNSKNFNPYRLPPHGVLERNVYPFVNFREKDGKLLLTGLSAETVKVLNALWQLQLM
jgi:hypothetical protein